MGIFGDILSSAVSIWNAEENRDAAAQSQANQENFQREMSNTQYQRMVKDLNASGLSPMLAYSGGKPNVPSTSAVSGTSSIDSPKFGETSLREAQTEQAQEQTGVLRTTQEVNTATAEKLRAEKANIDQDTENKRLYPGMNEAQINQLVAQASQHGASAEQLKALMDEIRQTIKLRKPEERFATEEPEKAKWLNPIRDSLKTIFEGVGLLRGTSALPNVTKVQRSK